MERRLHEGGTVTQSSGLRLLPWSSPDGKPCFLFPNDDHSALSQRADEIEALQLALGAGLLHHARALLGDRKANARELRFLADRLCEALRDVLRVAESRGGRLAAPQSNEGKGLGGAPESNEGSA